MPIKWTFNKDTLTHRFEDDRYKLSQEMYRAVVNWLNSGAKDYATFIWYPKLDFISKVKPGPTEVAEYNFERGIYMTPVLHELNSHGGMVYRPSVRYHAARCINHTGIEIIGKAIDRDPHSVVSDVGTHPPIM